MRSRHTKDVSISLAILYLKTTGFWFADDRAMECFRSSTVIYTIVTVTFCLVFHVRGLYFCWNDITISTYVACNTLCLVVDLLKIGSVLAHKRKFLRLILHMQTNFWHWNYDQHEKLIIADVKRMCICFVCILSFSTQLSVICYFIRPIITNIGRNESDRTLLFDMWLDLPLSMTPYYEITYMIQVLSLFHCAVAYLLFDNIFCIMCLHVAGQFRVLQYRTRNFHTMGGKLQGFENLGKDVLYASNEYSDAFKRAVMQHQSLVEFCATLDEVFRVMTLAQVLSLSMIVCLVGYQIFLVNLDTSMRVTLLFFTLTNISQLWMFTYSCDCVTRESANVGVAAYESPWIHLPMDNFGKLIRRDLQLVIVRSRRACYLSACGFFSISLETFTKIISTSMSYFMLLKGHTLDADDTSF